jgi:hypothetical protein
MATGLFHRRPRGSATDEVTAEHAVIADDRADTAERRADERSDVAERRAETEERRADADRAYAHDAPTPAQREAADRRVATEEREAARQRGIADTEAARTPHPLTKKPVAVPPGGAVAPRPAETEPEPTPEPEPQPRRWARTSFAATLSLIVGTAATLTALTGRLAPLAIVVGVLGLLLSAVGLAAVSRKHVTGHHVALLGLLLSIVGVVFGILAINRSLPWLSTGADNVGHLRDWLDSQFPWFANW